jgi:hypothetical protein
MKHPNIKQMFGKMTDYRRFAIILMSVGVFFYLGIIIPTLPKTEIQLNIMMAASLIFFAGSIFYFNQSKLLKKKLLELEDGQE